MLPALFYPLAYLLSKIKLPSRYLTVMVHCFIFFAVIATFVPYGNAKVFDRKTSKINKFHKEIFLEPLGISRFENLTFEKEPCTNFEFYNPIDTTMYYSRYTTGNGPIPCVQVEYLLSVYRRTGRLPALIGDDLGQGFTNIPVKGEEH